MPKRRACLEEQMVSGKLAAEKCHRKKDTHNGSAFRFGRGDESGSVIYNIYYGHRLAVNLRCF